MLRHDDTSAVLLTIDPRTLRNGGRADYEGALMPVKRGHSIAEIVISGTNLKLGIKFVVLNRVYGLFHLPREGLSECLSRLFYLPNHR